MAQINRRAKEQNRVLVITDKALYNCMPNDPAKCKRRIAIEKLSVSESTKSEQFVVHVPEEYDYHYKSVSHSSFLRFSLCCLLLSCFPYC